MPPVFVIFAFVPLARAQAGANVSSAGATQSEPETSRSGRIRLQASITEEAGKGSGYNLSSSNGESESYSVGRIGGGATVLFGISEQIAASFFVGIHHVDSTESNYGYSSSQAVYPTLLGVNYYFTHAHVFGTSNHPFVSLAAGAYWVVNHEDFGSGSQTSSTSTVFGVHPGLGLSSAFAGSFTYEALIGYQFVSDFGGPDATMSVGYVF